MKNKKIWIYLCSGFIPVIIFIIASLVNSFVPFDNIQLNIYDSFTQYPGFILAIKKAFLGGNLFYSFGGALGFNLFSTLTYYGMSPLNILSLFANSNNYPLFISLMTYIRIILLGLSMCFYLQKKDLKPIYIILFSTLFALMGFTSSYYYNYMWIDGIIMLPIVTYGLDRLIEKNSPGVYIFSLFFTIYVNFYIGYMVCIFAFLYYMYRLFITKKVKTVKTFILSSLLSFALTAFILLPVISTLLGGKASGFNAVNYGGISPNSYTFALKLLSGTYEANDQMLGPALIYSGIITIALVIYSFFNKNISKREKIANGIMLIIFYLSLSVNAINYAWQMFQEPVWWSSRFSFIISFFMIIIASKSIKEIEQTNIKTIMRIIISLIFIILTIVGIIFKFHTFPRGVEYYIFIIFGILTFVEMIFLLDKKYFMPFLVVISFLDVAVNTYNSMHHNITDTKDYYSKTLKDDLSVLIPKLNKKEENRFFRMELTNPYTSNDGLYFGYNGINYFNSLRNDNTLNTLKKLGVYLDGDCALVLKDLDPVLLSLLNVKYIYGNMEYFKKNEKIYTNPYPLGIGFVVDESLKNIKLNNDKYKNLTTIVSSMLGYDTTLYKTIDKDSFKKTIKDDTQIHYSYVYKFKSDSHYLLMPLDEYTKIIINGKPKSNDTYHEIHREDEVIVSYDVYDKDKDIYLNLLEIDGYEQAMKELEKSVIKAYSNKSGHILDGNINVTDDGYLFMSVPYEKGIKVYVDDKKIDYDIVLESFIGFNIEKGNHKIYIDYTPHLFKEGIILSAISLFFTFIYLLIRKKNI